jgi:hypothetical protein
LDDMSAYGKKDALFYAKKKLVMKHGFPLVSTLGTDLSRPVEI